MCKLIKKQIKRSMPLVLVLFLLNFLIIGTVFNYQLDLAPFSFAPSQVNADTATTSVTVRNAPPAFVGQPVEVPASTANNPVNEGATAYFQAKANDPESNNYYLIVCSSNAVTPRNGQSPTCGATTFCTSAATVSGATSTCAYSNVTSATEQQAWYAFVCDGHATEADCDTYRQGTGNSGTPLYVNHAPVISSATTTENFKNPGDIFTFQATAYDDDIERGDDVLTLFVCSSNSWATSTGCSAITYCTGTSTVNPSCSWTSGSVLRDQAYNYFAFVMDDNFKGATGNSRSGTYTVNNVAPTIGEMFLNGGNDITIPIRGAPAVAVSASSALVDDNNGCIDLSYGTSTIYLSGASGGPGCTHDPNNCYQIANTSCAITNCAGGTDARATLSCTTTFAFYTIPTKVSGNNGYDAQSWFARLTATDDNGVKANSNYATLNGVEVLTTSALDVNEATIPYGIIRSSFNTGAVNATTTIINYGNTPLDTDIRGTDMVKGADIITVDNQEYSLDNFTWGVGGIDLSNTDATVDVEIDRPTQGITNISDIILWGIGVPAGRPSGVYTGTNTFTAVLDGDGGWN